MANEKQKLKARPLKQRIIYALSLGLPLGLFSFMLILFGATDLYFANVNDFWFSYVQLVKQILPVALGVAALIFVGLMVLGVIIKRRKFNFISAVILAGCVAVYLQGALLSTMSDVLTGDAIDWVQYKAPMLINAGIWVLVIVAIVFVCVFWEKLCANLIRIVSLALSVMMLVAGITAYVGGRGGSPATAKYFLEQGLYDLGEDGNVIVFMVDTVDTMFFDRLLAEDASVADKLDGFTYYRNMGGSYRKTAGSQAYFFSQEYYTNQMPFMDYVHTYVSKSPMLAELKALDYDVRLQLNEVVKQGFSAEHVDNLAYSSSDFKDPKEFTKLFYNLLGYHYLPMCMQPFFFADYTSMFSAAESVNRSAGTAVSSRDATQLKRWRASDRNVIADTKAFRYFSLQAAHQPYYLNAAGEVVDDNSGDLMATVRGTFDLLFEYMDYMREVGVYDDAAIIIMADHGDSASKNNSKTVCNPLFLIKYPNEHGSMHQDNSPVSHEDMTATVLKAAGSPNYANYGIPVDEWTEDAERDRIFYTYNFTRIKNFDYYFVNLTKWAVGADATDLDAYVMLEEIEIPQ